MNFSLKPLLHLLFWSGFILGLGWGALTLKLYQTYQIKIEAKPVTQNAGN